MIDVAGPANSSTCSAVIGSVHTTIARPAGAATSSSSALPAARMRSTAIPAPIAATAATHSTASQTSSVSATATMPSTITRIAATASRKSLGSALRARDMACTFARSGAVAHHPIQTMQPIPLGYIRAVRGPLRVAFADDSYLVREAISHLLATDPRIELVAVCEDGDALRAAIAESEPDVVVTDIRMPPSGDDEGIRVATMLRETRPKVGVVVVSQYADPRYGLALLADGSDGRAYLLKERLNDRDRLMSAIQAVATGGSVIDPKVVEALIAAHVHEERSALADLTQRELQILSLIAQGQSNQAIAESLVLTKRAVEKHINAIFVKLGLTQNEDVSRRVKAALIYLSEEPHSA